MYCRSECIDRQIIWWGERLPLPSFTARDSPESGEGTFLASSGHMIKSGSTGGSDGATARDWFVAQRPLGIVVEVLKRIINRSHQVEAGSSQMVSRAVVVGTHPFQLVTTEQNIVNHNMRDVVISKREPFLDFVFAPARAQPLGASPLRPDPQCNSMFRPARSWFLGLCL